MKDDTLDKIKKLAEEVIEDPYRCQISSDGFLFLYLKKDTLRKLLDAAEKRESDEACVVINARKLLAN